MELWHEAPPACIETHANGWATPLQVLPSAVLCVLPAAKVLGAISFCLRIIQSFLVLVRSYTWATVSYEIVMLLALIVVTAVGALPRQKVSWIGMMSIATVLYITAAETFYAAQDSGTGATSEVVNRTRTLVAGSMMVGTAARRFRRALIAITCCCLRTNMHTCMQDLPRYQVHLKQNRRSICMLPFAILWHTCCYR